MRAWVRYDRLLIAIAVVFAVGLVANFARADQSVFECPQFMRPLSYGATGEDVRSLQKFLVHTGVLARGYEAGNYDHATEAAVAQWQIIHMNRSESEACGIVGTPTREAIEASCDSLRVQ